MDKYLFVADCINKSCGCLPPRSTAASIAVISMFVCAMDSTLADTCVAPSLCRPWRAHVAAASHLLQTFFFVANMLLLLASIVESALLVKLYVWYTLSFVLLGLAVSLADFLARYHQDGACRSCAVLASEVAFLFVIFRCLALVDTYRKHLQGITYIVAC